MMIHKYFGGVLSAFLLGSMSLAAVYAADTSTLLDKTQNYPVDLPTVLKLVEDQSLPVASDKASDQISRSLLHQSVANILPSVEGSVLQSHLKGGSQVGGQTLQILRDTVQPQVTAFWTLNPGGQDVYTILAAKRRKKEADLQVLETLQEQLSGAAQDYFNLLAAEANREQVLQSIADAQEQVNLNTARLATGVGNKLDMLKSQTLLADQEQALTAADVAISTAEQALLNRLNLDSTVHLVTNPMDRGQHLLVDKAFTQTQLIKMALEQSPAYQKSAEELKALGIDYKAIRGQFIPSITLSTSVNGTGPQWDELHRSDSRSYTVNMNLLNNLGLNIPFQLEEKRAEIQKAVIDLKTQARSIETQLTTAFLNSHSYETGIQSATQDRDLAQETYNVAFARFKAGFGTNLDVVDAATTLASARVKLVQAVLSYNQAQVQLVQAIGQVTSNNLVHGVQANAK